MTDTKLEQLLGQLIFIRGENRPLGELTLEDVRERAAELRSTVGWGPTARVAPIARAWAELAITIERAGVGTVRELPEQSVLELGPKLWVTF
jgi:hypothetical protein